VCNSKDENFINFCGVKVDHHCASNFLHVVGIEEVGYNIILKAFTNNTIASFDKVLIVNPLYDKLLKLVFVVCSTCNCFDANWL
jgi:hypothetical protein